MRYSCRSKDQGALTFAPVMDWSHLLSYERPDAPEKGKADPLRNDFERDHDRIVFSSAFRSLQDKTQVVPLPEHDFVHTRLTHSLETSCVGRSLGKMAAEHLLRDHQELKEQGFEHGDLGAIVAAACLAHDIGNPPFGHSGEKAIGSFFRDGIGQRLRAQVGDDQAWKDLTDFEGNANGFRILTHSEGTPTPTLTCATLGAFTKYPCPSDRPAREHVASKKFGFFKADENVFGSVAEKLALEPFGDGKGWVRHPLAFLVEAADDICYSIIDLEDGLRAGLIPKKDGENLLKEAIGKDLDEARLDQLKEGDPRWSYLRAKAINVLVADAAEAFAEHETAIRTGTMDRSLIKCMERGKTVKKIKALSFEKVYRSKKVLEIEAAGFEVIGGLLEIFTNASLAALKEETDPRQEKILELLPAPLQGPGKGKELEVYERLLDICGYVSGMSDSSALSLYRKLKGIELPT
ncbi:MAG: dGTP triphosphohydrolase [Flavobacteriales bacterium]